MAKTIGSGVAPILKALPGVGAIGNFGKLFVRFLGPVGLVIQAFLGLFTGIKDAINEFKETGNIFKAIGAFFGGLFDSIVGSTLNLLADILGFVIKKCLLPFHLSFFVKDKTKIKSIRNYPENTNLEVEYVYSSPSVLNGGSEAVTDGRNVSIKVLHSLVAMPDNDFSPRFDDPRVGYFTTEVNDQTSTKSITYRDIINRWNLIKKDPELAISEPLEPITWWIENSTPLEWRETITNAVLQWNFAFEKAGFKNALVVKIQPDDAQWDAGDIRYNVLRWTSSPKPPFGGYGPSFVNPKTGQILGADIMFEYVHFTNRVLYDKIYDLATLDTPMI